MTPSPDTIKPWIDLVIVYGGTLVLFSIFLALLVRVAWWKVNAYIESASRPQIEKIRRIHQEIDAEENEKSIAKMRAIQMYLEEHSDEIFTKGIDRVNVWVNHNGTRAGKFHFIFYSLIAEVVNDGVKGFGNGRISPDKLPYYIFADYENEISKNGYVFKHSRELSGTPAAVAKDVGTKTVYGLPITGIRDGKMDGIIFFSSATVEMKEIPCVDRLANDVRALLIS